MNERRPMDIRRPAVANSETRAITVKLSDQRPYTIAPSREEAEGVFNELVEMIKRGGAITFNDPSGMRLALNSEHVVSVELQP